MFNEKCFKDFIKERNVKSSTAQGYVSALKLYSEFNKKSLSELLDEARIEEEINVILKDRKIKKRLIRFRNYLIHTKGSKNTIKTYFNKVKTFYTHYEIELPVLPDVKIENAYETNYYDLPNREHIRIVIDQVDVELRSIILFMSSSGTAKAETLSLTVKHFIDGCRDYYNPVHTDLKVILDELSRKSNIVPTIFLRRLKTDKYYYTFCSPEASMEIIKYLRTRPDLDWDSRLFDIKESTLLTKFQDINDKMGWGFKGKYRFFRSHTLRKFHASNIGLGVEYIDALQGRRKDATHNAYIKDNPEVLKKLYMDCMRNVMIYGDEDKEVTQEFTIVINVFLSGKEFNIM